MAIIDSVTYKCDSCGVTEMSSIGKLPNLWITLRRSMLDIPHHYCRAHDCIFDGMARMLRMFGVDVVISEELRGL